MKANRSDVANVATISQALEEFNTEHPKKAKWKLTFDKHEVTKWFVTNNEWKVYGRYSWDRIRVTHNCGYKLDYGWLKDIISHDITHRKFFYDVFYSSSAEYDLDWNLKEWTGEPSAPHQYMSGGRLYWSDLPR